MSINEIKALLDILPLWQNLLEILRILLLVLIVMIVPYILDGLYEKYFG